MSPFLLGVSLSLQDQALGGAYTFAHGKRPAFFVFGHHHSRLGADKKGRRLVRRIHRGRPNVPVRSSIHASFIYIRKIKCPAGILHTLIPDHSDGLFALQIKESNPSVANFQYYVKTYASPFVRNSFFFNKFISYPIQMKGYYYAHKRVLRRKTQSI